ncbi:MAG: hypothetical protein KC983_09895 [Phycisphaerales bacterium]|nr:hypothetical protein [Phycisphaerales bacterium]
MTTDPPAAATDDRDPAPWARLDGVIKLDETDVATLPTSPGVYAFENADGHTLRLTTTSGLRRAVRDRLAQRDAVADVPPAFVPIRIRFAAAGSRFEADHIYLAAARRRLPKSYAMVFDRWACWFITAVPTSVFPRFTKQRWPGVTFEDAGVSIGPFADKHAAQRYIEMLDDAFDLCRYHHILVQAPNGRACAYKEMGRCAAPCDGTVSMDSYRATFARAVDFAGARYDAWSAEQTTLMHDAGAALRFEEAREHQRALEATAFAARPALRWLRRSDNLRGLVAAPSPMKECWRLFGFAGGRIESLDDIPASAADDERRARAEACRDRVRTWMCDLSPAHQEHCALTARTLTGADRAEAGVFAVPVDACDGPSAAIESAEWDTWLTDWGRIQSIKVDENRRSMPKTPTGDGDESLESAGDMPECDGTVHRESPADGPSGQM